jgi:hypothetical protein
VEVGGRSGHAGGAQPTMLVFGAATLFSAGFGHAPVIPACQVWLRQPELVASRPDSRDRLALAGALAGRTTWRWMGRGLALSSRRFQESVRVCLNPTTREFGIMSASARSPRFWSLPCSKLGWLSAALSIVLAAWAALLTKTHSLLRTHVHSGLAGQLTTGRVLVGATAVVGIIVVVLAWFVVRKSGERSGLVIVPAGLMAAGALFWLLFGLGELLSPV